MSDKIDTDYFEPKYECEYTGEIVCPNCGYEITNSWEVNFGEKECVEYECQSCDKKFDVCKDIKITYSSNCLKHKYVDTPSDKYPDCIQCENCGNMTFKRYEKPPKNKIL